MQFLFSQALRRIRDNPETWHQGHYSGESALRAKEIGTYEKPPQNPNVGECGTAYCLAGHVIAIVGKKRGESVSITAQQALNLDCRAASWLFYMNRTIEDFEAVERLGIDKVMRREH